MRRLTLRATHEDGAISVMAAGLALAMLLATALAVDVGRVGYVSRDQQGVTDRAALDAVAQLNTPVTTLGELHTVVEQALAASLIRNPGSTGTADDRELGLVEVGFMDPDGGGFVALCSAEYDPATEPDCPGDPSLVSAVRVVTSSFVPFLFAVGSSEGGKQVFKESIAHTLALASVRVGSDLAAIDEGLLNEMLETVFCSAYEATTEADVDANGVSISGSSGTRIAELAAECELGVTALGYDGLANAQVTLGDIVEGFDLSAGSPDQVLDTEVTVAGLLTVMVQALDDEAGPATVALNEIAAKMNQSLVVNLGDLFNVETGTVGQAAAAAVNVFDVLRTSAQLVNGTNALTVPDTGATIPGMASVDAAVRIIEKPQSSGIGRPGVSARTAQTGVALDTALTLDLASTVVGLLSSLTGTVTATADPVLLPVDVGVAAAEATLSSIACGDSSNETMSDTSTHITTSTDVVTLSIGEGDWVDVSEVRVQVRSLLGVVLADAILTVQAQANVPLGGAHNETNTFWGPFVSGPARTTGGAVDFAGLSDEGVFATRVEASGNIGVLSTVMGSLSAGISDAVELAALPVIAELDSEVVQPALDALGVGLGNADTWTESVHCDGRRLAPISLD